MTRDWIHIVEADPVIARFHAAGDGERQLSVPAGAAGSDEALVEVEPNGGAGRGFAGDVELPLLRFDAHDLDLGPWRGAAGARAPRARRHSAWRLPAAAAAGGGAGAASADFGRRAPAPDWTARRWACRAPSAPPEAASMPLISTVTDSLERWRLPSGAMDCSTILCEPGGSGGGVKREQAGIIRDGAGVDLVVAQQLDGGAGRGPARDDAVAVRLDPHDVEARRDRLRRWAGVARQGRAAGTAAPPGAAGLAGRRRRRSAGRGAARRGGCRLRRCHEAHYLGVCRPNKVSQFSTPSNTTTTAIAAAPMMTMFPAIGSFDLPWRLFSNGHFRAFKPFIFQKATAIRINNNALRISAGLPSESTRETMSEINPFVSIAAPASATTRYSPRMRWHWAGRWPSEASISSMGAEMSG